jgi:hypothetical protein
MRGIPGYYEFVCRLTSSLLELLLQFAYLGYCEMENTAAAALELLKGAWYLHMNDASQFCLDLLTKKIDMSTAIQTMVYPGKE